MFSLHKSVQMFCYRKSYQSLLALSVNGGLVFEFEACQRQLTQSVNKNSNLGGKRIKGKQMSRKVNGMLVFKPPLCYPRQNLSFCKLLESLQSVSCLICHQKCATTKDEPSL